MCEWESTSEIYFHSFEESMSASQILLWMINLFQEFGTFRNESAYSSAMSDKGKDMLFCLCYECKYSIN